MFVLCYLDLVTFSRALLLIPSIEIKKLVPDVLVAIQELPIAVHDLPVAPCNLLFAVHALPMRYPRYPMCLLLQNSCLGFVALLLTINLGSLQTSTKHKQSYSGRCS